jgi:hypothetical protein
MKDIQAIKPGPNQKKKMVLMTEVGELNHRISLNILI